MTLATAAYGTILEWNGDPVAEITSMSGPSLTIDTIDATHYTSPQAFKEFIAGFGDAGELTLECNLIPSDDPGQITLIEDAYAKTVRPVTITLGNPVMMDWSFDGLVTKLDFAEPLDNKLSFSVTIKISGVPTYGITLTADLTTLTGIEENIGAALTFTPAFLGTKYSYNIAVNTASDWIQLVPTLATSITTITQDSDSLSQTVASGATSGTIALKVALSITVVTLKVRTPGNIAKTYTLHVYRA
jgi:predicted secreted protein